LSDFPLLPEVGAVLTLQGMCMALLPGSTLMRETTVSLESSCSRCLVLLTLKSDIVGNNIPVFFIQDAILFPDLIHAVKPSQDNEIPQAATAHDSAWDFFSQQPSSLHTLFWAMAGNGIPRSFRHIDGFGVHTFRFVTDDGTSKLVKFHWTSLQGKASLVWEEAQATAGKNADYHRQDLYTAIAAGRYPEWEACSLFQDVLVKY
jgi:catalase